MRSIIIYTVLACATTVLAAPDLGVPLSWRKFSNSRSLSERISISQAGINKMTAQLNSDKAEFNGIGFWQSANVFSAMANQDHFTKATTNKQKVLNGINKAYSLYQYADEFGYNDDAMWWATAAYYAYRAYGDTVMLNNAISTWQHVLKYQITPAQASAKSTPVKKFSLAGTCEGATMAGGVFWRTTTDDQGMNSITTGLFLTLSAYLAEASGGSKTYLDPAIAAAKWIKTHNINSNNIILDSVNAHDCGRSPADWRFTYNSGKFIEGLSVLVSITRDSAWKDLMVNTVAAATKSAPWQGKDGIITEASDATSNNDGVGFKAVLIRGLNEAFVRNQDYWDFQVLIHSYIDVQYNALLDLARNGDAYSINWHGPARSFTAWGQLAALDVLVSAISANT